MGVNVLGYESHPLNKLLLVIEIHVTTAALSLPRPARGRKSNKPSTLPPISHVLGVALELPCLVNLLCSLGEMRSRRGTRDRCPCTVPEVVPMHLTRSCARVFHQ